MRYLVAVLMVAGLFTTSAAQPNNRTKAVFSAATCSDTAWLYTNLKTVTSDPFTIQIWHDGGSADTLLVVLGTDTTVAPFYLIDADVPLVLHNVSAQGMWTKSKKSGTTAERRILAY